MELFTLTGQVRGGKNHINITRTGKRYPSKLFARWVYESTDQLYRQLRSKSGFQTFREPVSIGIDYWPSDRRIRDIPAIIDALFHVLEKVAIVKNDFFFKRMFYVEHDVDREHPRVTMEIRPLTEDAHA